jgi:tetratricopeptide (TPR) repeat protein
MLLRKIIVLVVLTLHFGAFSQMIPSRLVEFDEYLETLTYEEKYKILDEAIRTDPKEPWFYWMYAGVYNFQNQNVKAIEYYEKALQIDSNFSAAHASISRHIYSEDNSTLDKALYHINKAINVEPENGMYLLDRGRINKKLKRFDEALMDAKSSLNWEYSDPFSSYQLIAEILHLQNKKEELKSFLQKYDLSKSMHLDFDLGLLFGSLYSEFGDEDKACSCYKLVAEPYEMMEMDMPKELNKVLKKCK